MSKLWPGGNMKSTVVPAKNISQMHMKIDDTHKRDRFTKLI